MIVPTILLLLVGSIAAVPVTKPEAKAISNWSSFISFIDPVEAPALLQLSKKDTQDIDANLIINGVNAASALITAVTNAWESIGKRDARAISDWSSLISLIDPIQLNQLELAISKKDTQDFDPITILTAASLVGGIISTGVDIYQSVTDGKRELTDEEWVPLVIAAVSATASLITAGTDVYNAFFADKREIQDFDPITILTAASLVGGIISTGVDIYNSLTDGKRELTEQDIDWSILTPLIDPVYILPAVLKKDVQDFDPITVLTAVSLAGGLISTGIDIYQSVTNGKRELTH